MTSLFTVLLLAPGVVVHETAVTTMPDGSTQSGWQKTTIAGARLRRESSQRPAALVLDAEKGEMIALELDAKRYFRLGATELADSDAPGPMMDGIVVGPRGAHVPEHVFTETGKHETISDWDAREVQLAGSGRERTTWWVAEPPEGISADLYRGIVERVFSRKGSRWAPYFEQRRALQGFPVRTVIEFPTPGGTARTVLTVTRIEHTDVPDSVFEVPPDFVELPSPLSDIHTSGSP